MEIKHPYISGKKKEDEDVVKVTHAPLAFHWTALTTSILSNFIFLFFSRPSNFHQNSTNISSFLSISPTLIFRIATPIGEGRARRPMSARSHPTTSAMAFHLQLKPAFLPLLLLLSMLFVPSYALSDPEILLKFKSSLTNATALEYWENNSKPPCNEHHANWVGVLCDNGTIWGLQLENIGLSGSIDVNTLTGLSNLRTLSFMNNNFSGPIPELNKLIALKSIYLSNNRFSGDIPGNAFAGMIWLKKLHLSQNQFTGAIPASLATLPKLLELKLDGNQFSGQIPDFKQQDLQKVDVSNNGLEGSIPASLSKMNASMFSGEWSRSFSLPIKVDF